MQSRKHPEHDRLIHDLRRLWSHFSDRHRKHIGLLLVLMVLSSISEAVSLGAAFPFLAALSDVEKLLTTPSVQPLLNLLQIETASQLVTTLALGFIVAILIANSLRLLTLHVRTRLATTIGSDLSCRIYQITLSQPYDFYVRHNSSDLMQTVTSDTNRLTNGILMPLLSLVSNALIAPSLVATLVFVNGRAALLAALILGGVYALIYRARKRLLKRNSQLISQAGQRRIKAVQEGMGGIRDVLLANTQDFFLEIFRRAERSLWQAIATNGIVSQTPTYLVEALSLSAIALLALYLGRDGDFSQAVPVLGSVALGAKRLVPSLQEGFASLAKMQGARASLIRVLIALQRPMDPLLLLSVPQEPIRLEKELRLEQIWFRYSAETDWVLKDVSLAIEANTTVGFVGSTGSGKSTTADLILGLLQPQQGALWVDGCRLAGEQLRRWQQSIAHVPQSIFLADATIAENIAFGIPPQFIDSDQIHKAAQLAQLDSFIETLPARYETYVGEQGIRLSGGQRQRVGIARALYRQASVIVFDEATSALDNKTEREVMKAIYGLSHQFTVILIAHRLSTVESCDRIFELDQGRISASGTFKELLSVSSTFRNLAAIQ